MIVVVCCGQGVYLVFRVDVQLLGFGYGYYYQCGGLIYCDEGVYVFGVGCVDYVIFG